MGKVRSRAASILLMAAFALLLLTPLLAPAQSDPLPTRGAGPVQGLLPASTELATAATDTPWWETWSRDGAVPGIDEAILRLERDGLEAAVGPGGLLLYRVTAGVDGLRYDVFVRYDDEPGEAQRDALATTLGMPPTALTVFPLAEAIHVPAVPYPLILAARLLPGVVAVELERLVMPMLDVAGASALVVRTEDRAGAHDRWRVSGRNTVIAVLDTGIEKTHEAIAIEHYIGGYNATIPTGRIGDELASGVPTWTELNTIEFTDDSDSGHGTHVAGIAFGKDPAERYVGMAGDARFLDVKVFNPMLDGLPGGVPLGPAGITGLPYGWGSFVLEGMEFVKRYNRGESHLGDPGRDLVRIALFAFGELEPDPLGDSVLAHATNRLVDTGVVVVAAAGNCGPAGNACPDPGAADTIVAPGAARQAITVGSMNHNGTFDLQDEVVSGFSSRGPNGGEPKPNLVGYGEPITAPVNRNAANGTADAYRVLSGTSQSAAQVAGIAALILEIAPELTPEEVKEILVLTARDKGPRGWDPAYGAGVVNALFAVGVAFGVIDLASVLLDGNGLVIEPVDIPGDPEPTVNRQNRAPAAAFRYHPAGPIVDENIVFIDRSTDPEGDPIAAQSWDFGDGTTAKGARVVHTYTRPGEYRVVLTATDAHGAAGSTSESLLVVASPDGKESSAVPVAVVLALLALLAFGRRRYEGDT